MRNSSSQTKLISEDNQNIPNRAQRVNAVYLNYKSDWKAVGFDCCVL